MRRILLFIATNVAVMVLLTIIMRVFGLEPYLTAAGLNYTSLLIFSALFGFAGSIISLLISKKMAMRTFKIRLIKTPTTPTESRVHQTVRGIATRNSIKMPDVGIYPSAEVNAFATGYSKNNALVAVSQGMIDRMTDDEIEGVIGHEMAHVLNGDMVTMTLLQGVVNTFVIFFARVIAQVISSTMSKKDDGGGLGQGMYFIVVIVLEIVLGFLASLIVHGYSRKREFAADKGSAQMVGKSKMIAALEKLRALTKHIDTRQKSFATLKISDQPSKFSRLFATHPPLSARIQTLQRLAIH